MFKARFQRGVGEWRKGMQTATERTGGGPPSSGPTIIDGEDRPPECAIFEDRSAIDERDLVGVFPQSPAAEVEAACRAAREAFPSWSGTPASIQAVSRDRGTVMTQKERLARIVSREVGKTPREAEGEVQEAIDTAEFFEAEGRRLYGQTVPSELRHKELFTYLPFGGNGWSGNGTREGGILVLDAHTRWQAVNDDVSGALQLAQIETDYGQTAASTDWPALDARTPAGVADERAN